MIQEGDSQCLPLEDLDFFDITDYQFSGLIGASNAPVYKYILEETVLALKELKVKNQDDYKRTIDNMRTLQRIKENSHPNIIKIMGFCKGVKQRVYGEDVSAYLVMEYCEGNLDDYIQMRKQNSKVFTSVEIGKFFAQTVSALEFLQCKLNIAHRDIKPENILIHNGIFKIADLDDSKIDLNKTIEKSLVLGTVSFMAPELLKAYIRMKDRLSYNAYRSDVYSLGLCMLYMCTFEKFSRNERIEENKIKYAVKIKSLRSKVKEIYGVLLSKILKIMLDVDPWKRPDFLTLKTVSIEKGYLEKGDFYDYEMTSKRIATPIDFSPQVNFPNNQKTPCRSIPQLKIGSQYKIFSKVIGSTQSQHQVQQLKSPLISAQAASTDSQNIFNFLISPSNQQAQTLHSQGGRPSNQIEEMPKSSNNQNFSNFMRSRSHSAEESMFFSRTYSQLSVYEENPESEDGSFYTESFASDEGVFRKSTQTASAIIRFTKQPKEEAQCLDETNEIYKHPSQKIKEANIKDEYIIAKTKQQNSDIEIGNNSNNNFCNNFNTYNFSSKRKNENELKIEQPLDPQNNSCNREQGESFESIRGSKTISIIEKLLVDGFAKEDYKSKKKLAMNLLETKQKLNSLSKQRKIFSFIIALMLLGSITLGIVWLLEDKDKVVSEDNLPKDNDNPSGVDDQKITIQDCQDIGKLYHEGKCVLKCPSTYYYPNLEQGICVMCDASCLECTNGQPNFCKKCPKQSYLLTLTSGTGLCLPDCPNTFRKDDSLNKCLKCPENCISCENSDLGQVMCMRCASEYFLLGDNLCISVCPKGMEADYINRLCTLTSN